VGFLTLLYLYFLFHFNKLCQLAPGSMLADFGVSLDLGREMTEMASYLNKQKRESLDALACAAEAEGRLHTANER
jgi:hypothetical protein